MLPPSILPGFLAQASILLILAAAAGTLVLGRQPGWGLPATAYCLAYSALWALVLGVLGLRSSHRTLTCRPQQMAGVMMLGMFLRIGVLAGTHLPIFAFVSPQWGGRALLATTAFYLLVLGLEVVTLQRLLRRPGESASAPGTGSDHGHGHVREHGHDHELRAVALGAHPVTSPIERVRPGA